SRFSSSISPSGRPGPPALAGPCPGPIPLRLLLASHERFEDARPIGAAQLPQRLCLDLADALAGDGESLADLLERVVGLLADTEPQPEDLLLARRQRGEHLAGLLLERECHGRVGRRQRLAVLDEIAERALLVVADWRLERHGLLHDLEDLSHLV